MTAELKPLSSVLSVSLALSLALPLAGLLALPSAATDSIPAGADTVRLVELFTSRETADLPPDAVPVFMAVDPKTLPARLRAKYTAKRIELAALKKEVDSRKKGLFRRMGNDKKAVCDDYEGDAKAIGMLAMMGFVEIDDEEELFLMRKTNCSECELNEEFSLTIFLERPKKKGEKPARHLFLKDIDPLFALVDQKRSGGGGGTGFFGTGVGAACR